MSVKSRLRRLDAGVRWLETEGVFVRAQLVRKLVGILQDMSDHAAAHPDVAAKWKKIRHLLPPPRVKPSPAPAQRPAPSVLPILRDAAVPAAPQDEGVRDRSTDKDLTLRSERSERLEGYEPTRPAPPPRPPPPPKPRWTKDIRPGPHDVLTWEEVLQVPWVDSLAEEDGS